MTPQVRRAIRRWVVQAAAGTVGYGLIIFVSAGTLRWVWGWLLLVVLTAVMAAHPLILVPINPDLLAERQKGMLDTEVKPWDKWITGSLGGLMILTWIIAGMQNRYSWGEPAPLWLHLMALLLHVLGYALFLWAMASNAFFSEGVRIQEERGHSVATGGPYHFVRHPGYVGAIIANLATPPLLGSTWALVPALLLAALFVLRTHLEDRTLLKELPGYREYTRKTRFRLLPGVW